jgi:hypothetical protein
VGGGISRDNWCSPVSLLNVSQAGLELTSGGTGALLFSQCTVVWGSFVWAMGSGCQSFDSFWCFISAKCGSSVSAGFLIFFFFFLKSQNFFNLICKMIGHIDLLLLNELNP